MFVDQDSFAGAKTSRANLMTEVRTEVDADPKTRAQIEADANMAEGDLDRVLAADYITLEQAHEIFKGLSHFDKRHGPSRSTTPRRSDPQLKKEFEMQNNVIWTIVGILAILALIIFIASAV